MSQGFYIVTYGLGIYLLNRLIGFLSPMVDPELEGPTLPTKGSDQEFKPFQRRLPEFKFWCAPPPHPPLARTAGSLQRTGWLSLERGQLLLIARSPLSVTLRQLRRLRFGECGETAHCVSLRRGNRVQHRWDRSSPCATVEQPS